MVCNLTLLSRNVVRLVREVGICEAYAPAAAAADLQRLAQRESREGKPQRPKDCAVQGRWPLPLHSKAQVPKCAEQRFERIRETVYV